MRRREFIALVGYAAAGIPLDARAQEPAMPVIGVVTGAPTRRDSKFPEPLVRVMGELGFAEGRNCRVLFLWTEGHSEGIPGLVGELVARRVSVIVVTGNPAIEAAQRATTTIPIVGMADDMLTSGFAASMARPGGNFTGVSILSSELDVKRLELLHEAVPTAKRIGLLVDPTTLSTRSQLDEAARKLDLELVVVTARDREEVAHGLDALESAHIDADNVLASPVLTVARELIIERLNRAHLPAIYHFPETAEAGGASWLRSPPRPRHPDCRQARRQDPERRQARGSSHRATDDHRAGRQPQDCEGARPHHSAVVPRPSRRGDRMRRREFMPI
jgi:putative tryptophan/tyrosine transport system substrate-binding protein